jgi:hypothetical protein
LIKNLEEECISVIASDSQDISLLFKTQHRQTIQDIALQPMAKVTFNHVFTDIVRENEFQSLSKLLKVSAVQKLAEPLGKPAINKGSFISNANTSSTYMQATNSWNNKNKPSTAPPLQP